MLTKTETRSLLLELFDLGSRDNNLTASELKTTLLDIYSRYSIRFYQEINYENEIQEHWNRIDDLCKSAIDVFGIGIQIELVEEEFLELAIEMIKYKRNKFFGNDEFRDNVIVEFVDASVMLRQLEFILSDNVDEFYFKVKNQMKELIIKIEARLQAKNQNWQAEAPK